MKAREELIERLAEKRRERLGGMSAGAFDELVLAVRAEPEKFIEDSDDQAFYLLVRALERHERAREGEDALDDDAFFASRTARMERLGVDCRQALAVDVQCLDAALLSVLAADDDPVVTLDALLELERHSVQDTRSTEGAAHAAQSVRARFARRALLRLRAAIARSYLECAHYRLARDTARTVVTEVPGDPLGARHTCALALARLEDESGFDALDASFGRAGSAWDHLGRSILLYKLDRLASARRALDGYARLCEGGAYALLVPVAVDTYLPDRFEARPASYEEVTMAIWEAEPIIADIPDFVDWAADQPNFLASAEAFAGRAGLEW